MSTKLKGLSLGVLAALAASVVFGGTSATGDIGGHFTSDLDTTTLIGKESGSHTLHFKKEGSITDEAAGCSTVSYDGARMGKTFTDVRIDPNWKDCYTTKDPNTKWDIIENSCFFIFRIGDTGTHHTVTVTCQDPGKIIEMKHPNCTITVPPQTVNGVVYKTDTINNKHAITLEATVQDIKGQFHSGICVFLGTEHEFELSGSVTVEGVELGTLNPTNITATTKPTA